MYIIYVYYTAPVYALNVCSKRIQTVFVNILNVAGHTRCRVLFMNQHGYGPMITQI